MWRLEGVLNLNHEISRDRISDNLIHEEQMRLASSVDVSRRADLIVHFVKRFSLSARGVRPIAKGYSSTFAALRLDWMWSVQRAGPNRDK